MVGGSSSQAPRDPGAHSESSCLPDQTRLGDAMVMDSTSLSALAIFVLGTATASFITGVAGFAFGLVAAAIWLYALTPIQTTTLIVAYGLLIQGYAVWKLRRSIDLSRLAPLIIGSAIGVPFGIVLLRWVSPAVLRTAIGV